MSAVIDHRFHPWLSPALALARQGPAQSYRSVRIRPGAVHVDRVVIPVDPQSLGLDADGVVEALARDFGFPDDAADAAKAALEGATGLLIGYERSEEDLVKKVYFEHDDVPVRANSAARSRIVHLTCKWSRGRADTRWTRYATTHITAREAATKMSSNWSSATLTAALLEIVEAANPDATGCSQSILEVTDQTGGQRTSLDVLVSDALLTVEDCAATLAPPLVAAGVLENALRAALEEIGPKRLARIAGGWASDGGPFLTLYYLDRA